MEPLRIGITYTGTDEKHNNYVSWIKGHDSIEVVSLSASGNKPSDIELLDGIVLSGGVDVHPKYYFGVTGYPNAPEKFNEERDAFEYEVFELSQAQHIPLLGICRGMQLANCLLGGTLMQDLGPDANKIHRFEQNDKDHVIDIVPGTLLNVIMDTTTTIANSAHHQAIAKLGAGLLVNARSRDGIIEGVEWADKKGKSWFLCVQWHPERMYKSGQGEAPAARNIREDFIEAIKKSKIIT